MAEPLDIWAKKVQEKFRHVSPSELNQVQFFRDPIRPQIFDDSCFFSPADGTIMSQKIIKSHDDVVEIKGMHYKLKDVFAGQEFGPSIEIGIFMSVLDVHINRIPLQGLLQFRYAEPILSYNMPMNQTNFDLIHNKFKEAYQAQNYLKYNARMINKIYNPYYDYTYHLVQIADDEVNTITPFATHQKQFFHQNQRFSFLRGGSHVELILPLDKRFDFRFLVPQMYHVKGGLDRLIKIKKK